jgi:predicted enzyme related to lactoylglutathione lyase
MFCRYALRTTDPQAARAFYAEALGVTLPDGMAPGSPLECWPLHERALARGAPAHWLGLIAVDDVDAAVARLVARGGEPLGPTVRAQDGASFAALRDPHGAVVGVRAGAQGDPGPVVWHQLHTGDAESAWALYRDLFGWAETDTIDAAGIDGGLRLFASDSAAPAVGAVGNTARRAGVHTHWLYHFAVEDLDAAIRRVRALGGTAAEPHPLPGGRRLVACEDPQRAAFGLASG